MESTVFLIVTSSWAQEVDFTVIFDDEICSVSVAHGDGGSVSVLSDDLADSMSGIDGRVYRVLLAENGLCP